MAYIGVGYKTKGKKSSKTDEQKLLEKAKKNFIEFLINPKRNRLRMEADLDNIKVCLLYTSPSPRD